MNVDTERPFVHVVMFGPDGRVVCQKFNSGNYIKKWGITEYGSMPTSRLNYPDFAIETAVDMVERRFDLKLLKSAFRHVISSTGRLNKKLEIVTCNLPSGSEIHTNEFITIKLSTMHDICKEIDKDNSKFEYQSIDVLNLLNTMCGVF